MKKFLLVGTILFTAFSAKAQNPVNWSFTTKKTGTNKYEVYISATIKDGWHIYAPKQPETFIGERTKIQFTKNPIIKIAGDVKAIGLIQKRSEKSLGIESWEYKDRVDFVQQVEVKSGIKTSVTGNISFQACTDEMCLPPAKVDFSIKLE